ncbi:MAG: YacL family protein [Amphritea sp.]
MDYEFSYDLTGAFCAEFTMGHEALGYWLTNELEDNQTLATSIFNAISQLQTKQRWDYVLEGTEYNLLLSRDDATVRAHALDSSFDDELETDLDFYDDESTASCGLDDFLDILKAWLLFVNEKH